MNPSWSFKPDNDSLENPRVPYFEEARADKEPNYRSRKNIAQAKADVISNLGLLGAGVVEMREGTFEINGQTRKGYEVVFNWAGNLGVMRAAGLPMKTPTAIKEQAVKVQALLNLSDWIKAMVTLKTFSPGDTPLLPYLLVDGKRTLTEALAGGSRIPLIERGNS